MANGAAQASAGYPVWLTLNSGADSVLKLFAAIVTLGMSLLIVHGISLKVAIKQK
jgi:hypothetical protein